MVWVIFGVDIWAIIRIRIPINQQAIHVGKYINSHGKYTQIPMDPMDIEVVSPTKFQLNLGKYTPKSPWIHHWL